MRRHAPRLETVWVTVPAAAVDAYEAALRTGCDSVAAFEADAAGRMWRVEGVRPRRQNGGRDTLAGALALAAAVTGIDAALSRAPVAAEGWLERTRAAFPEQAVGRFVIRGEHLPARAGAGRIVLRIDAGMAFGSGEHGSTRGCLRALEVAARRALRRPRVLDVGTGSAILAIAAAKRLRTRVIGGEIDPASVPVARRNARRNGVGTWVRVVQANGWRHAAIRRGRPYDLVFANILARPLCRMAPDLARGLAPGGRAILSGMLTHHAPMVLAAHRRLGLARVAVWREGPWTTLMVARAGRRE